MVTVWHRIYFAAVGSFALWVGIWGYGLPAQVAWAIPWDVPPLHARFIGSMYLSGFVVMAGGFVTLGRSNVGIALRMASIWTGMLLLVSLLHLDAFDFAFRTVWFWFAAYVVYPVAGAYLALVATVDPVPDQSPPLPRSVRTYLRLQAAVCLVLAACLFLMPSATGALWPWPIPVLLAQIYSGPFLSFGIGSLLASRVDGWRDLRVPVLSMFAFALLVLVASVVHRPVFGDIGPAAALWFGGFALSGAILGGLVAKALSAGSHREQLA